jgi:hypothetical protein
VTKTVVGIVFLSLRTGSQKSIRRSFGFRGFVFPVFYLFFRVPETGVWLYLRTSGRIRCHPVAIALHPLIKLCFSGHNLILYA